MKLKREDIQDIVLQDLRRANDYFEETVEPKLLERRDIYLASKEYYQKKFPLISKKSDFRSFGFYSYVQWAKVPILDSLFGTSRVVHVIGCGPEDEEPAQTMEQLIQWELSQQSPGYHVCAQWIEDALKYEFGVLKLWWKRATEKQTFNEVFPMERARELFMLPDVEILEVGEPDYFDDVRVKFTREFLLANMPVFDNISPFDLRWSPEARTLEEANFVAQRSFVSSSELLSGVEHFGYDKAEVREICEGAGNISTLRSSTSAPTPPLRQRKGTNAAKGRSAWPNATAESTIRPKPKALTATPCDTTTSTQQHISTWPKCKGNWEATAPLRRTTNFTSKKIRGTNVR